MREVKGIQSEISGYISNLLREHFGKGPTSVYVAIKKPFVTIHFRGFISPMEKALLKKDESKRVLEMRDLLVKELQTPILKKLSDVMEMEFQELYFDWNLSNQSGLFIGVAADPPVREDFGRPAWVDEEVLHRKIEEVTRDAQKKPGEVESYWLNDRNLLVKRIDILVEIERALINGGYGEVLRSVKRPLERRLLEQAQLHLPLRQEIHEIFLDWNFNADLGYILLVLAPPSENFE
jgi:uncharacterized protein YbcI